MDSTISGLEDQIRDHINRARTQFILLQDPQSWNQLCSSLDVIGDTELCFDAYEESPTPSKDGATYILVYGVLQALVLQQDAVRHMSEALAIPFVPDPLLQEIREVRNSSIGHPTKRDRGGSRSHFISRISMSKNGFQLMTVYPDHGPAEFKWVDIPSLISKQRTQLRAAMTQVVSALAERDREHRGMFKDAKLVDAFPPVLDYYIRKVFESTHGSKPVEYGGLHVKLLQEAIERFKSELERRGSRGAYDAVEYHIGLVEYPLTELADYFQAPGSSRLNERDAYIFASFVQEEFDQLRRMAAEIDEDYAASDSDA
jgi:hypothetical protein